MSQNIWGSINPLTTDGVMLATLLTAFKNAVVSGYSGTSRPSGLLPGGWWVDTTNSGTPNFYYSFKFWSGVVDIEAARVNVNGGFGGGILAESEFSITRISADTTAAILKMVKQRIATSGQLLDGDVVAEIQLIGRTATSTNPIVANLKWTSSDNETASVFGGYFSLSSTPDSTAILTEHIRLITGLFETIVPHKMNSQILVSQDVATTAVISALDGSKILVEFTGSTVTSIQGINATQSTREIVLHNRSSAVVTLKHQDLSATSTNRIKISGSADYGLNPDCTITLVYNDTETRWKVKSTEKYSASKVIKQYRGLINDFVVPSDVGTVLITPYKQRQLMHPFQRMMLDVYGNAYAWGNNARGNIGDASIVAKSSPVAVVGGFTFTRFSFGPAGANFGGTAQVTVLDVFGNAYSWGTNTVGEGGRGTITNVSSPVAVIGGLRFRTIYNQTKGNYGITLDGKAYAWGQPALGTVGPLPNQAVSSPVAILGGILFDSFTGAGANQQDNAGALGVDGAAYVWGRGMEQGGAGDGIGNVSNRSSPVAVLGGLIFKRLHVGFTTASSTVCVGLTKDGAAYAWGDGTDGNLGTGTLTSRSSPVAVIGGHTFMDLYSTNWPGVGMSNFGLKEDGSLYAWGYNISGELGVGDTIRRSSPVAVLGGFKFRDICAGPSLTYGITLDGLMYAWGNNPNGELGVGDVIPRSSPVAVLGGFKWSQFVNNGVLDGTSMMAVAEDGTLYGWGANSSGILGVGDVASRSSPVAVLGAFGMDNRCTLEVISVPVTPGTTQRIYLPQMGPARFGNTPIGIGIEKVTIEYETGGS